MAKVEALPAESWAGVGDRFFGWSLDMLAVSDFEGRFLHVNPAWERVLGWTPEELTSRPFLDFVHPEDRAATVEQARRLMDGEDCLCFVNRYQAKDGSYRWVQWTSRPVPEEARMYGIARDITALKEAELALQESEERLRLALRAARMGIWEWDSARGTVKITQGVTRLMELESRHLEWSLEPFLRGVDPSDLKRGQALVRSLGGEFDWTFRVQGRTGAWKRLRTQGRAVTDLHGDPVKVLGTLHCLEESEPQGDLGKPSIAPPNSSP
ncbi:MAG: PAS domain-containing protein [Acidobacteria bacterium]|nr:PAS domain-containing protein [Acidobacteriota bacterium]